MYYKEYGKATNNIYPGIKLAQENITNVALEMFLSNVLRDLELVHEYGGNSLTIDIAFRHRYFSVDDIVNTLVNSGFKVVITQCSELRNKVKLTVIWVNAFTIN